MHLPVTFYNRSISALVDTGSSINIMSRSLYDSLPFTCKSIIHSVSNSDVLVASGETVVIDGTAKVRVKINNCVHSVLFHIFPKCTHPVILGTNYLIEHKIVLDFSKGTISSKQIRVKNVKSFEVPPESEILVWGKVPSSVLHGTQGICTNNAYLLKQGLLVAKSLCTVSSDRLVPVKLLNPTKDTIFVPKGKYLAAFELLNDMHVSFFPMSGEPAVHNVQIDKTQDILKQINLSTHLSDSQKSEFYDVFIENADLFVTVDNPSLGFTDLVQHRIILKPDVKPKHQRPYRLAPDKKDILRHHLDELLAQGIISPVKETEELPITSPIVLVSKRCKTPNTSGSLTKDESLSQFRFCCDFRYLNSQTEDFRYAIPNLQELTESFSEFTPNYFSSIDLSSGFFQMGIAPESTRYTAFNTCFGTFKFLRLPMGLSTAPNSFQLLMDKVLRGLTFKSCLCYLDDVLIASEKFSDHIADVREVFERFRDAGLKLNPKKCFFGQESCIYLGHLISREGIRPPPDRVKAIEELPIPTDVQELRRALGLFNWFRKYIANYSAIASPLQELLRKGVKFTWTDEHSRVFEHLKSSLVLSPVLAFPDFRSQFRIAVDTSSRGIGYMLYQKVDGDVRVIRFGSKSLSKWQRSYGPTKLELLGMVVAILDCADYVRGSRFVVECDHQALRPLFQNQLKGAIYERWLAILQQFSVDIEYKPAEEMQVPDTLSRNLPNEASDFTSPAEDDPYFPYVTERVGEMRFPEGRTLRDLINAPTQSVPQTHNVVCLPSVPVHDILDLAYDADTDEPLDIGKKKKRLKTKSQMRADLQHTVDEKHLSKPENVVPSRCDISLHATNRLESSATELDANAPNYYAIDTEVDTPGDILPVTHSTESGASRVDDETIDTDIPNVSTALSDIDVNAHIATHSSDDGVSEPDTGDFSLENIRKLQRRDSYFEPIITYLEQHDLPEMQKDARKVIILSADYFLYDGLLYHSRKAKSARTKDMTSAQLALPQVLVKSILRIYHDSSMAGHCGTQTMLDLVKEHYFFPKMALLVSEYVQSCHECQSRKVTTAHTKANIISYPLPKGPFEVWQMDLYGPLPISLSGNTYIFTAVDMFSKLTFAQPIRNKDAITVAHAMYTLFCTYGTCHTVLSDQGSEFMSSCTREVCRLFGISQEFTPSFQHHCLGAVERSHRTLAERLTPYVSQGKPWEDMLPAIVFSMNCSPHASLCYAPFEIVFGTRPTFPLARNITLPKWDPKFANVHHYLDDLCQRLETVRSEVAEHAARAAEKMVDRVNRQSHVLRLAVGDYVYLRKEAVGKGRKLKPTYAGPYVVHKLQSDHLVVLREHQSGKCFTKPVHINRLKMAYVRVPNNAGYLLDRVVTNQRDIAVVPTDIPGTEPDIALVTNGHTTTDVPEPEVTSSATELPVVAEPEVRRSSRVRQKPAKFRDGTFVSLEGSESDQVTPRKIKRILAERTVGNNTEYLVHYVGEPAQNAGWVPRSQLTQKNLLALERRPPPQIV